MTTFVDLPIVNVSQVPQISPLRYPGGKSWFYPYFRAWLKFNNYRGRILIEPFAGGASISLQSLFEGLVSRVVLVETDEEVFNFWRVTIDEDGFPRIIEQISRIRTEEDILNTLNELEEKRSQNNLDEVEKALLYLIKNRINYGGITAKGSSKIKRGENGRGLTSRWYPDTLIARLSIIHRLRNSITIIQGDGVSFLEFSSKFLPDAIIFADPPYILGQEAPGTRLYNKTTFAYKRLFATLANSFRQQFILTHSPSEEITSLAEGFRLEIKEVPMKGRQNQIAKEIVVANDTSWVRRDLIETEIAELKSLLKEVKKPTIEAERLLF